jgi:tetratricopeptide (TPR) repeat protein
VLIDAYAALSAGKLESSQQLYNQLLKSDPRSIDAHLGLADIASQQGDRDAASRHYVKVLELDPRNPLAQAGLIGLLGRADPQAAETRVKQLITRDPGAAYLHFTLGNTYVDQARWPDAQQAFFQAHHLQPDNPDYAYNLAVALEHIGQPKSALDFYRRAVLLAAAKGHANFSPTAAQERVTKLEKVVQ